MSTPEPAPRLGDLLRAVRTQRGFTLEELSARAGVGVRTLGDLERNRIGRPHRRTIQALLDALEVDEAQRSVIHTAARPATGAPATGRAGTGLVGRVAEMADLEQWYQRWRRERRSDGTVVVSGIPGVGKTSFVKDFMAGRADGFPDGRVCVDLGGSGGSPMEASAALGHLLEHVGVPRAELPATIDERTILLRRRMQTTTMLIGLADARDETQVRPLLPDYTPSLVIISTRRTLAGLHAGKRVALREPDMAEALELLASIAGPERLSAEPGPAAELVRLCGNLPLALRLAAARLTTRPNATIAGLVERLRMPDERLDRLTAGDVRLRDVVERHYRLLPIDQQRTFRRLCVLRGPRLTTALVAATLGISAAMAEDGLESLVDAGLLTAEDGGQYLINNLIRLFGREMLAAEESAASISRLLGDPGPESAGVDEQAGPQRPGRPSRAA